jgi:alcohol dehydrogenase class IV
MIKKCFFRIFHITFYKAARFLKWRKPLVLTGAGSVKNLPEKIKGFGFVSVLLVADKGVMQLKLADPLIAALASQGIRTVVFAEVTMNPTINLIEKARELYAENKCEAFVAVGGGSAIDTAKAAAARIAKPKKTIQKMGGFLKVRKKTPPVFAVPTTAGTGSEVTVAAVVIEDISRHKYAISDPVLIPVGAVLDPQLIVGLPADFTAYTGMDALTHAVEAYITLGVSSLCKRLSKEAVRLVFQNVEKSYQNGSDIEARQNMLFAAFKAGDSFTRAGLTYVHPIAHALGGLYNEAHGRANAVILPYVLEAFGKKIHKKLAELASAAGLDVAQKSESEAAALFISEIKRLNRDMGIPEKLTNILDSDVSKIVKWTLEEANPWYSVPVIFGAKEIEAIIKNIRA